jgi:Holliday junction resolvase RusA-like endonuclease
VIELIIPGLPIGKARHRQGKFGAYNPQSEQERGVVWEIKRQIADFTPTEKPLILSLEAFFPRPKSHYGTGRNSGVVKQSAPKLHVKKPDIDNLCKFYMDCMNKVVYKDDCQVVGIADSSKKWIDQDEVGYVRVVLRSAE